MTSASVSFYFQKNINITKKKKKKFHINAVVDVLDLQNPKWPWNRCWAFAKPCTKLIDLWATVTCPQKLFFDSGASRSLQTSTQGKFIKTNWIYILVILNIAHCIQIVLKFQLPLQLWSSISARRIWICPSTGGQSKDTAFAGSLIRNPGLPTWDGGVWVC